MSNDWAWHEKLPEAVSLTQPSSITDKIFADFHSSMTLRSMDVAWQ
jgi:hypothetical protein